MTSVPQPLSGVLAAVAGRQPDWNAALDVLLEAAVEGSVFAQQQLRLLAGSGARGDWRSMRAAVDVSAWLRVPPKEWLSESPRLRRFAGFLDEATCAWLRSRADGKLQRARVYDKASGGATTEPGRTNTECDLALDDGDLVLLLVRARIATAASLPVVALESTKILHYGPSEQFSPHFDFLDPAVPGFAAEIAARGQRLATLLVYLNDDYEGGETAFPELGLKHRGARGDALMFANVGRDGAPDRQTLHAGLPPTRGAKWLLSQWLRERPQGPA